jgi:hypothetical protein
MPPKAQPHDAIRQFFQGLTQGQFSFCWSHFSDSTQKEFIKWTLSDLQQKHPEAIEKARLGPPEIKLMFETNHMDLITSFWRRFFRYSRAAEFARYAYYETIENNGKQATVQANLIYDNGQAVKINLLMKYERNGWRFAYLESGLSFF